MAKMVYQPEEIGSKLSGTGLPLLVHRPPISSQDCHGPTLREVTTNNLGFRGGRN